MSFLSLDGAIDWARSRWDGQRTVPTRLHTHDTEGIGLFYAPGFASALDGSPSVVISTIGPANCYHPLLNRGDSPLDCPECHGSNVKEHRSDRFVYPMSAALDRLARSKPISRSVPHPYGGVMLLASHGWDARSAAKALGNLHWDVAEPYFLLVLRKLHDRYNEGPTSTRTSPGWVDLSESQRAAESAA